MKKIYFIFIKILNFKIIKLIKIIIPSKFFRTSPEFKSAELLNLFTLTN